MVQQLCVDHAARLSARWMCPSGVQYVEAAASDEVWRPWSTSSCPVQLGLRTARLCGVAARERAVVCRGGGPGRWYRWIAQGVTERWKSVRRLRDFCNIESVQPCVVRATRLLLVLVVGVSCVAFGAGSSLQKRPVSAPLIVFTVSSLRQCWEGG
jgi:hypothetical protein